MTRFPRRWIIAVLVSAWSGSVAWAACYWYRGTCSRSEGASCGRITVCPTTTTDAMPPWACGWSSLSPNQQSKFCYSYKNAITLSCDGAHPGFKRIEICVVQNDPLVPLCCWVPADQQPEYDHTSSSVVFVLDGPRCGGGCSTTEH